jgi:two-component system, OmpR family, sensor histidine kinase QseC
MKIRLIPNSLKKQLLLFLLLGSVITWTITAFISFKETQREVEKLFSAELAQSAGVLHAFVESMLHEGSLSEHWDATHASNLLHTHDLSYLYATQIAFQLWSVEEGLLLRSASAPQFALSASRNGYSQTLIDDHLWFVFSIANHDGEYIIHVGQREDVRHAVTHDIARQLVQNFMLGLPLIGIIIWIIVSKTLAPINHLKQQLAKRKAGYLEPIAINGLPGEIIPVVNELNNLFRQLEQAFINERNFTSDASHELRTPLAGLLTQIQVAQRTTDEDMRIQALRQAQHAVMRTTRMVQQLLTLSRVQSQNIQLIRQTLNINEAIIGVISETEVQAHKKSVETEYESTEDLQIDGNPELIHILLRNLIENAIKYVPEHGLVRIRTVQEKDELWLSVEDNGHGIKDADRERLTQRFFRCVETANTVEGSGLGLSIVLRIAAIHQAKLHFARSALGGLHVLVVFKLASGKDITLRNKRNRLFKNTGKSTPRKA